MTQAAKKIYSPAEYLALEAKADYRSEYFNGEIFMMAGGTANHNLITVNVATAFKNALSKKGCRTFTSDMRLHIAENGLYTYPDVMLVCEPLKFVEGRRDTITNPVIIVEVISESTANYDRGLKAKRYRALESLQFYIIIEQGQVSVELRQKVSEGDWLLTGYDSLNDTFSIPGLGFELTLSEIYDQVDFVEELK